MDLPDRRIRVATPLDAAGCVEVYAPYITDSAISFETEVPSESEMARRISDALAGHAWLVLEVGDAVAGFAYAHAFKTRAAYAWSCESSIYLRPGLRRTGAGRALYDALLPRLAELGYRRVFAGVTLPNDASVGLHRAFGFEPVGTYRRVGWKGGAWHDVAWMQRDLGDPARALDPPREVPAVTPSGSPAGSRTPAP